MLLRILTVICCCFIYATHSGPVTKIDEYSNDLTENENFEDLDDQSQPKIYDDVANLEVISSRPSALSKRMIGNEEAADVTTTRTTSDDLISYVSKNMETEVSNVNLMDAQDVQKVIGAVLKLYGQYVNSKEVIYERGAQDDVMLSDQPMNDEAGGFKKIVVPTFDEVPTARSYDVSSSERPSSVTTRDDGLTKEIRMINHEDHNENRTKDIYRNAFKQRLLANINRPNSPVPSFPNLTIPFPSQTLANGSESPYMEKIRSFYPTCDIPKNTKEAWKEENLLNLFFNVDYDQNATIATATLRLHRLPKDNQTATFWNADICPENTIFEDEKLIRVSIYWYVKSTKKHSKVKRRLCDSKMISENAQWVELSVKAATKTWTKSGKNMGLAILVEDQDGGLLKASKYFKGATCTVGTVGTPTPRPIPTLITDTAKQANDSAGIFALLGVNQTGSISGNIGLLPKIDICVLELPGQMPLVQLEKGDCDLKNTLNEMNFNLFKTHHHIRHQKHLENEQHQQEQQERQQSQDGSTLSSSQADNYDVRSKIINKKIIMTKDVLEKLNNASINR